MPRNGDTDCEIIDNGGMTHEYPDVQIATNCYLEKVSRVQGVLAIAAIKTSGDRAHVEENTSIRKGATS